MLNPQRLDTIRNKIQNSTLLTVHEKSDWLNLLELMNDKQLGELEEILAAEGPTATKPEPESQPAPQPSIQPQSSAPEPPITSPSSFVDSNIDSQIVSSKTDPIPSLSLKISEPVDAAVQPPQSSAPEPPASTLSDSTAPDPKPLPSFSNQAHQMPPLSHIANIPSDVSMNASGGTQVKLPSKPTIQPVKVSPARYASAPAKTITTPKKLFTLEDPEQLQGLSIETIREFELQSIVDTVYEVIAQHGYFYALHLIETSQLYSSYIESGKLLLQNQPAPLTQAEFEFITDLLRNMRFSPT